MSNSNLKTLPAQLHLLFWQLVAGSVIKDYKTTNLWCDRLHLRRQRDSRRMNRQSQYKKSGLSTYSLRNKREEKRNDTKQQRIDLIMRRRGKMPLAKIQEVPLDKTSTYRTRVFYLNYTIIFSHHRV